MNMKLEIQATQFLKKHGYKDNGQPYATTSPKVEHEQDESPELRVFLNAIRKSKPEKEAEIMEIISGSFATRVVRFEELSFVIDYDFKKNTSFWESWLSEYELYPYSRFEYRLYNLIVQRYLVDGYGIYHYRFVPKRGVYFSLYELLDDEIDEYKENYFRACEGWEISQISLKNTRKLYEIGEGPKCEYLPGKLYVSCSKEIAPSTRKVLKGMFGRYLNEMRKLTRENVIN